MFVIFMNFGAGVFANAGSGANVVIRFISYISPIRYAVEAILRRVTLGQPDLIRNQILDYFGYTYGINICLYFLFGFLLFIFLLGWLAIYLKNKRH